MFPSDQTNELEDLCSSSQLYQPKLIYLNNMKIYFKKVKYYSNAIIGINKKIPIE